MTQKQYVRSWLIAGIFFLSLGGWLLHGRIHPLGVDGQNWIPFLVGLLSTIFIPLLFIFRATSAYAYVLNGMTVIIGTVTMGYFSIGNLPNPLTLPGILLGTLLPDIIMLWAKFAMGKAVFELDLFKTGEEIVRQGRLWRYPNMGWWWAHLAALTLVFTLGVILWK